MSHITHRNESYVHMKPTGHFKVFERYSQMIVTCSALSRKEPCCVWCSFERKPHFEATTASSSACPVRPCASPLLQPPPATWREEFSDVTDYYAWADSFTCMPWLIPRCNHSPRRCFHHHLLCEMSNHTRDMPYTAVYSFVKTTDACAWYDSFHDMVLRDNLRSHSTWDNCWMTYSWVLCATRLMGAGATRQVVS